MNKTVKENLIFILVAHVCFLAEPALAQEAEYHPLDFVQELSVARGKITPIGQGGKYLDKTETCNFVKKEFGWSDCKGIDQMIFFLAPDIDNAMFEQPISDGYVTLDDWKSGDLTTEIEAIEQSYKESLLEQGKRLNENIIFDGWLLYPTLDEQKKILYYANIVNWNGDRVINVTASVFDRYGYVPIKIVPADNNLSSESVKSIVDEAISAYRPGTGSTYAEFSSGDKVAGYGALGVLATLLGVKYGKAAVTGLIAVALVFAKKLWFLIFLPLLWIGRLFSRNRAS
jgi:uncharacterized membrane-anchored protein